MPDYAPLHDPGNKITRRTTAPVTAGQLLQASGPGTVAPTTAATASWLGVAASDANVGDDVVVHRQGVQRLVATGTITAGQNVEADIAGRVAAHTNGTNDVNVVGLALTSATIGQLVEVKARR